MNENPNGQTLPSVIGTSLSNYGEREEVRELASRMMKFHPAFKDVGETGMIAAAQLAILSGANPLPTAGEIHVWQDWRGETVVMLGIAFWRRKAREVDAPIWFVDVQDTQQARRSYEPRLMHEAERAAHGVLDGDIAAICKAYRLSEYLKLIEVGTPWQVAQPMITRTGIGIVKHKETVAQKATRMRSVGDPIEPPHGRTWVWVACKRAEQDVYRALSLINENFYSNPVVAIPSPQQPTNSMSDLTDEEFNDLLFG
jgi:hypothetical protein